MRSSLFIALAALTVACPEVSNRGPREGQIHNLARFSMSAAPLAEVPGFFQATVTTTVALEQRFGVDRVFAANGELWTIAEYGEVIDDVLFRYLEFARMVNGARVPVSTLDHEALMGPWCPTFINIRGVAYANGSLWIACTGHLLEMELATLEIVRSIPAPEAFGLAVDGDRAFIGTGGSMDDSLSYDLFEIALADGAVRRSYGQELRDTLGVRAGNVGPLGIAGGKLIVRGQFADNEAVLFDLQSGALEGFIANAPTDQLTYDESTGISYGQYRDLTTESYAAFELAPTTLRSPTQEQTFSLPLANARAIAADGTSLWALFADANGATMIAYDPATQQAIDGFVLDASLTSELFQAANEDFHEVRPVGLAISGGVAYIAVTSYARTADDQRGTTLVAVDLATGAHTDTIELSEDTFGMCAQGSSLYAYSEPDPMATLVLHAPEIVELEVSSGLVLRTLTSSQPVQGRGKLLCGSDALAVGSEEARTWSVLGTGAPSVEREPFAFGLSDVGHTGVELGGSLWMLDRSAGQLLQMTPMLSP